MQNNPLRYNDPSGHFAIPILVGLIAVTGFAGGAANYEFNVSGRSWWESPEDTQATFNAGMEGMTAALIAATIATEIAIALPAVAIEAGIAINNPYIFNWGLARLDINVATEVIVNTTPNIESTYPELEIDANKMPNVAKNIQEVQNNGAPSVLTRTTDQELIRSNRQAACSGFCEIGSPDEYPFASTYEGGSGATVKGVPLKEQKIQGGVIKNFYKKNNLGDGAKFRVIPRWKDSK